MSRDEKSSGDRDDEEEERPQITAVVKAVGSALGFVRRLVPIGQRGPAADKPTRPNPLRKRIAPNALAGRRTVARNPAAGIRVRRVDSADIARAEPKAAAERSSAVVERAERARAPAPSEDANVPPAELRSHTAALEAEVARIEAELESLYTAIAMGANRVTGDVASSSESVVEMSRRSQRLRHRLQEARMELSRLNRRIARERKLQPYVSATREVAASDKSAQDAVSTLAERKQPRRALQAAVQRAIERAGSSSDVHDRSVLAVFEEASRALLDDDEETRRLAVVRLGELATPQGIEPLSLIADSDVERVRVAALNAIANIGTPDTANVFPRFLHDQDPHLRLAALRGLAKADPASSETLIAALEDRDARVRKAAAMLLGWRDASSAIRPLTLALRDRDEQVRAAAAEALGALRADKAAYSLFSRLEDDSPHVRAAVENAIAAIIGSPVDAIAGDSAGGERIAKLRAWWNEARVENRLRPLARQPRPAAPPGPAPARSRPEIAAASARRRATVARAVDAPVPEVAPPAPNVVAPAAKIAPTPAAAAPAAKVAPAPAGAAPAAKVAPTPAAAASAQKVESAPAAAASAKKVESAPAAAASARKVESAPAAAVAPAPKAAPTAPSVAAVASETEPEAVDDLFGGELEETAAPDAPAGAAAQDEAGSIAAPESDAVDDVLGEVAGGGDDDVLGMLGDDEASQSGEAPGPGTADSVAGEEFADDGMFESADSGEGGAPADPKNGTPPPAPAAPDEAAGEADDELSELWDDSQQ